MGCYTLELNEQEIMYTAGAIRIAIEHLKQANPNNPNISILKNLLRRIEPA